MKFRLQVISGSNGDLLDSPDVWSLLQPDGPDVAVLEEGSAGRAVTLAVVSRDLDDNGLVLVLADNGSRVTAKGTAEYSSFGVTRMSTAGDFDGDGVTDFVLGDREEDSNGNDSGAVTVFSGRTAGVLIKVFGRAPTGDKYGEDFGCAVAGGGDVNGDGHPDILVGARTAEDQGGRVDVLSGPHGRRTASFLGNAPGDGFGAAVAMLGDINGDGIDDFAVGAASGGKDDGGYVTVFASCAKRVSLE